MFEGRVYLLFALHLVFSGAQHIYQPLNECSIQDCEKILRDIRNDIVELKHSVKQFQSLKESGPGMCSEPSEGHIFNNVAFFAQLTTSVTDDYVIFSHVITNAGTAYDKSSGIFTCQFSGTYAFSWTIASSQHHQTTTDLLVNDVSVGSTATYSRGSESDDLKGSSTGFVVYDLHVGDKVRVILNGTAIAEFSTFSGWKLQHDTPSFYARASTNLKGSVFYKVGYKFQSVLTNNRDVYNPDNGVITIPETGIWALTISVEVSKRFDSLSVGEPHISPRMWKYSKEDTSSSLLFRTLSYSDRLHWYSSYNTTLISNRSSISGWLIGPTNSRPTFMAASVSPTPSSPVNFTREYIDRTDSLLGSYFRASKSGVYLIFWNTIGKEMVVTTLLVNGKEAGRATTSKSQHSFEDNGSNVMQFYVFKRTTLLLWKPMPVQIMFIYLVTFYFS